MFEDVQQCLKRFVNVHQYLTMLNNCKFTFGGWKIAEPTIQWAFLGTENRKMDWNSQPWLGCSQFEIGQDEKITNEIGKVYLVQLRKQQKIVIVLLNCRILCPKDLQVNVQRSSVRYSFESSAMICNSLRHLPAFNWALF